MPSAFDGPTPGSTASSSGGAVFRLTTPSTALPPARAGGATKPTIITMAASPGGVNGRMSRCRRRRRPVARRTGAHFTGAPAAVAGRCSARDARSVAQRRPAPLPAHPAMDGDHVLRGGPALELPAPDRHRVPVRDRGVEDPDRVDVAVAPGRHVQVRVEPAGRSVRSPAHLAGAAAADPGRRMFVVAAISATRNMAAFWTALGVLAVLHATHDIACDGFYLQALNKAAQALYSGVRIAAFRVAMIVGSSVLVVLAGQTSWTLAFGGAGALEILVARVSMAVMPRIEDAAPATPVPLTVDPAAGADPGTAAGASKAERFFAAYRSFLSQPRAPVVLAFMFFYKLGDIMMFAMSKPLLRDIGVDTSHRGLLNGLGTFTFILGSVAGGALVARAGIERCLAPMTLFQNLAIPFYVLLAVVKPRFAGIVPVVLFEQFASGIGGAAHVVFLMRRCRAAFSASHYAFATAIVSLGSTLSGYASGPLNEALGHPWFFTVAFIASWPSLVLVWIVPKTEVEPSAPAAP